jgi:hypothetical protein
MGSEVAMGRVPNVQADERHCATRTRLTRLGRRLME